MIRPFDEIHAYARRLHQVDPKRREPIPVSPDEVLLVQECVAKMKGFTRSSMYFDMEILGHRLEVL